MSFLTSKWKSRNTDHQLEWVKKADCKKFSNHKKFSYLINKSESYTVKDIAVRNQIEWIEAANNKSNRIQGILSDMAMNSPQPGIKDAAIARITNQQSLYKLAKDDVHGMYAEAILNKITDKSILIEIATQFANRSLRHYAILKITDQNILFNIAEEDGFYQVGEAVMERLNDEELLAKIALSFENSLYRAEACKKITNQDVLVQILNNEKELNIKVAAAQQLLDTKHLIEIARNDSNAEVRYTAMNKINDKNILAELILAEIEKASKKKVEKLLSIAKKKELSDIAERLEAELKRKENDIKLEEERLQEYIKTNCTPEQKELLGSKSDILAKIEKIKTDYKQMVDNQAFHAEWSDNQYASASFDDHCEKISGYDKIGELYYQLEQIDKLKVKFRKKMKSSG